MSTLPPIRRQVVVPAGAQVAFDVFTEQIGAWWPVERHSVYGARSAAAFRDGRLIETGPDGDESVWGTVLDWDPPRLLRMTWHPGNEPARASEVEVGFAPVSETQTLVTITHSGWERYADPAAARDEYRNGWPTVLGGYAGRVEPAEQADEGPVWLVLSYTPGPGVTNPFTHPDFAEHPAFLERLRERGVLVAAGPFASSGEGMAVLRLGGADEVPAYLAEANEEDLAVVKGALEVRARPWVVVFTGSSLA